MNNKRYFLNENLVTPTLPTGPRLLASSAKTHYTYTNTHYIVILVKRKLNSIDKNDFVIRETNHLLWILPRRS